MQKKLTLTIDEDVYEGLWEVVGPGRISHIEDTRSAPRARIGAARSDLNSAAFRLSMPP
jgi:hypothetical protein